MESIIQKQQNSLQKLYELPNKPKLYITDTVFQQIKVLCSEISEVEWSGVLFHSSKGFVDNPDNFELTAEYILPMDKGSSAYTSYTFDDDYLDAIAEKPELLNYSISHIHSHNKMSVFFSGTDNEELQENAPNYDYYLSLIVNNRMEMTARVAFVGKIKPKEYIFKGKNGKLKKLISEEEDVIFYYNMDIEVLYSEAIDEFFLKHMERIQNKVVVSHSNNYLDYLNTNSNSKNTLHQQNSSIKNVALAKDTNAINFIKFLLHKFYKKHINCKETDTLYNHFIDLDCSRDWKDIEKCDEKMSESFGFPYKYNQIHSEYISKGVVFKDRKSDLISMCEEGYNILTENSSYSAFPVAATLVECFESVLEDFIDNNFDNQYKLQM